MGKQDIWNLSVNSSTRNMSNKFNTINDTLCCFLKHKWKVQWKEKVWLVISKLNYKTATVSLHKKEELQKHSYMENSVEGKL